jgi:GT2 family glycosyltransferase
VTRPSVSVVVPFGAPVNELGTTLKSLRDLKLRGGDEILLVDNTPDGMGPEVVPAPISMIRAPLQASSYYARNVGAESAGGAWLLFLDADCRPPETLLDDYFANPLPDDCGLVAGGVIADHSQETLIARWAQDRGHVSERYHTGGRRPAGITANLLVRRTAWETAGGFHEGIRSGGDIEFCWRLQELGWRFEYRPAASLEHVHVEDLCPLLRKAVRYGGGRTWLNRRYPGSAPSPRLARELARSMVVAAYWLLRAVPERALFKMIDAAWYCAVAWGHLAAENRAVSRKGDRGATVTLIAETFPKPPHGDDPALNDACVEAVRRPQRPAPELSRRVAVAYLEDDRPIDRAAALMRVGGRHPVRLAQSRRAHRQVSLFALAPAVGRVRVRGSRLIRSLGGADADALATDVARLAGALFHARADTD